MATEKKAAQMDPAKTICVVKHNGKEVGRIAATAPNASAYITGLVQRHREGVTVDYEENATEAMVSRLFGPRG